MVAKRISFDQGTGIPASHEVGLTGPTARLYDAQIMLVKTLGKPEYFVDLSMGILTQTDLALAEAKPEERLSIQIRCQQTLSHHAFLGRVCIDLMNNANQEQAIEEVLPFAARLTNDMVAALAESSANSADQVAQGNILAAKAAAPAAIAAALNAAAGRFRTEGASALLSIFRAVTEQGRIAEERRKWLSGVESLLHAMAARAVRYGPAPTLADIGRRSMQEIIALHRDEWENQRNKLRIPPALRAALIFIAVVIGGYAIIQLIFVGFLAVVVAWILHLYKGDAPTPPVEHAAVAASSFSWWWVALAVVAIPILWAGLTAFRRWLVVSSVRRRLRHWIRAIDTGTEPRGSW